MDSASESGGRTFLVDCPTSDATGSPIVKANIPASRQVHKTRKISLRIDRRALELELSRGQP
jgi:hypothetical protein